MLNAGTTRVAIGLHLTLTSPFRPMTERFRPLHRSGDSAAAQRAARRYFPPVSHGSAPGRDSDAARRFPQRLGHAPDFIDGHQHVHLFPQIRDALSVVGKNQMAVVPDCADLPMRPRGAHGIRGDRKGAMLDRLSAPLSAASPSTWACETNTAFAGTYDFHDFAKLLLPSWAYRDRPGDVPSRLSGRGTCRLDISVQRQREYDFFASDELPAC